MTNNISEYIKDLIKTEGKITFAKFMDIALYHPKFGYYNANKQIIGKSGDYYTSPDVHPFMGQVLGKYLVDMWKRLQEKDFYVVEMGAGKGFMALDILKYIKEQTPECYDHLTYIIIEKSETFKPKQISLLNQFNEKIKWLNSISCLSDSQNFTGCILSNELIDALPFHRVCQVENRLKEIFISTKQDKLVEEIDEPSTVQLLNYINRLKISLADGIRTEINLEAMNWMQNVAAVLQKGLVITIDYGFPGHLYYAPSRVKGTFLCYYNHTTNEEPLERIGKQDITAHADFTSLALEGEECGLDLLIYTNLSYFLSSYGRDILTKEMEKIQKLPHVDAFRRSAAIKNLVHPEGMGGTFKVLIQGKNVESETIIEKQYNKKDILT